MADNVTLVEAETSDHPSLSLSEAFRRLARLGVSELAIVCAHVSKPSPQERFCNQAKKTKNM